MNADTSKSWKKHLLLSGVPLEFEVANLLVGEGMSVHADFSYLRQDGNGQKELSIDISSSWYGGRPSNPTFDLRLLVECKYRSRNKLVILIPDPNITYPSATLGATVTTFDVFVPFSLPLNAFVKLERNYEFAYKAIEIFDNGAVEQDLKHGINQLRYAIPSALRWDFDFQLGGHPEEAMPTYFAKILVTNAPMRVLDKGCNISAIELADKLEDISSEVDTVILYSDYGPDYEDHFRSVFSHDRKTRAENAADRQTYLSDFKDFTDTYSTPEMFIERLRKAKRSEIIGFSTQFFVTTLSGLPQLIEALKSACKNSYKKRVKIEQKSRISDKLPARLDPAG